MRLFSIFQLLSSFFVFFRIFSTFSVFFAVFSWNSRPTRLFQSILQYYFRGIPVRLVPSGGCHVVINFFRWKRQEQVEQLVRLFGFNQPMKNTTKKVSTWFNHCYQSTDCRCFQLHVVVRVIFSIRNIYP